MGRLESHGRPAPESHNEASIEKYSLATQVLDGKSAKFCVAKNR
jgi:hypothetical protein